MKLCWNILFHTQGLEKFNIKRGFWRFRIQNFAAEIWHTDEMYSNKVSEMKILVLLNGYYFLGEEWRYIDRWGLGGGWRERRLISTVSIGRIKDRCVGCYCPVCLFVCVNIGTRSFVQHTVTYRSERSEWPVMSNSRERI